MQEEFAELISQKARSGAVFMVYGLEKSSLGCRFPSHDLNPMEGILALYEKT